MTGILTCEDLSVKLRAQIMNEIKDFANEYSGPYEIEFTNKIFFLTFPCHIDKERFITHVQQKPDCEDAFVYVVHETIEHGLAVSHCLLVAGNKRRFKASFPSWFNYEDSDGKLLTPFVAIIPRDSKIKWIQAVRYCCKQDKSNSGLLQILSKHEEEAKVALLDYEWGKMISGLLCYAKPKHIIYAYPHLPHLKGFIRHLKFNLKQDVAIINEIEPCESVLHHVSEARIGGWTGKYLVVVLSIQVSDSKWKSQSKILMSLANGGMLPKENFHPTRILILSDFPPYKRSGRSNIDEWHCIPSVRLTVRNLEVEVDSSSRPESSSLFSSEPCMTFSPPPDMHYCKPECEYANKIKIFGKPSCECYYCFISRTTVV